jgi:WD40 repeat protein
MLEASLDDRGSSLAFSPDGSRVIVGDRSGHITVWQISSINARVSTIQFLDLIHEIKAAPTGEFFIVNTDDKNVRAFPFADLLQIRSDTEGKDLFSAGGLTYSLEISPDVKWIAAAEKDQSRTLLYHIEDGKTTLLQQGSKVTDVAFTPDNAKLFTAGMDNKILIWDVHSGEKLAELVSTAPVLSIGVSVDGQYLVAGLDGREANMVWDLSTNQPLEAGLPQSGSAGQIAFSPDGRWLATGDNKGYILLWDMSRISEPEIINVHEYKQNGEVKSLLFSPDGAWLLSGSDDGFVHIWDITSNNELARLPHTNPVTGLAFSQDTKYLMVASLKVIQIWNRDGIELIQHENLVDVACQRLVVNLSQTDWEDVYGDAPYEKICPGLPQAKN